MTTLLDEIKALIAGDGPITVERYMELALAHPELRLLHEPRSVRRERRLHHRAGNLADVRRADRPVGGGGVGDAWARRTPSGWSNSGPGRGTLMSDALRAARDRARTSAPRSTSGSSRRARRWRRCSTNSCSTAGVADRLGADARRGAGRARRSSSPTSSSTRCRCASSCGSAGNGASASCGLDDDGRLAFDVARDARALHPARTRRDGEILEVSPAGPSLHVRARRPARRAGRRGAVHRLRPCGDRLRRHAAGPARASLCRSARRAGRVRPHRACRFRRDGAQRRARPARRSTGRSTRATSCARSASTSATKALAERAGPGAGARSCSRPATAWSARARARWARCSR